MVYSNECWGFSGEGGDKCWEIRGEIWWCSSLVLEVESERSCHFSHFVILWSLYGKRPTHGCGHGWGECPKIMHNVPSFYLRTHPYSLISFILCISFIGFPSFWNDPSSSPLSHHVLNMHLPPIFLSTFVLVTLTIFSKIYLFWINDLIVFISITKDCLISYIFIFILFYYI